MNDNFNAVITEDIDGEIKARLKKISLKQLPDEDVLVDVEYSTLNYKDGLAISGKSKICRTLPLICGIDLAGTVIESRNDQFVAGDRVLVNGFGLSEKYNGGYSQKQRLQAQWLVRIPKEFSTEQAMAIGTAGYTSMLCVQAIIDAKVPTDDGQILVTGASGGVGSIAVSLLATLGYQVTASTGRVDVTGDYLRSLGATEIIAREELARDCKPLEKETWAGVVDSVGDQVLATALAQTKYEGVVAACGLASGMNLSTSVAPFILRGVTLRGIDSVMASQQRRQQAWDSLAVLLDVEQLEKIYRVEPMSNIFALAEQIIAGEINGRVVIDVNA